MQFITPVEDTPEAAAAKRAARTRAEEALRGASGQRGRHRAAMTPAARAMQALTAEGAAHATRDESELEAFVVRLWVDTVGRVGAKSCLLSLSASVRVGHRRLLYALGHNSSQEPTQQLTPPPVLLQKPRVTSGLH